MELTDALKMVFVETAQSLRGAKRRLFMARIVKMLGRGGIQRAEKNLVGTGSRSAKGCMNWRVALRVSIIFRPRSEMGRRTLAEAGAKPTGDSATQSQIDPSFKTERLYTRLSAAEVRRQLIEQKGYSETNVPHGEHKIECIWVSSTQSGKKSLK